MRAVGGDERMWTRTNIRTRTKTTWIIVALCLSVVQSSVGPRRRARCESGQVGLFSSELPSIPLCVVSDLSYH